MKHFITAFLGKRITGDETMDEYLNLVEDSAEGVYAANEDGSFKPEHSCWNGFADRTAKGLTLEHETPAQQ